MSLALSDWEVIYQLFKGLEDKIMAAKDEYLAKIAELDTKIDQEHAEVLAELTSLRDAIAALDVSDPGVLAAIDASIARVGSIFEPTPPPGP